MRPVLSSLLNRRHGPAGPKAIDLVRGSFVTLLFLAGGVYAVRGQEVAVDGKGDLETTLVRSWAGDGVTIVDGLAQVPLAMMAGGATGAYRFEIVIRDSSGQQLKRDSWTTELSGRAAAYTEAEASSMLESFQFGLRPGSYEIEIFAYPTDAADLGVRRSLELQSFAERPLASDLILATRVEAVEDTGGGSWSVRRGNFGISATARTVILEEEPDLYYYMELYGGDESTRLAIDAEILNEAGARLLRIPRKEVEVQAGGESFTGRLPLAGLPAGNYELAMTISEGTGEPVTRRSPFELRAGVEAEVLADAGNSELSEYFQSLSDAELQDTFGGVGAFLTDSERKAYEALPPEAQRRYLTDFFERRDPDPYTPGNQYLDEYLERLATVTARYTERVGTEAVPSWQTDRGWLYLRLGEPQNRVANYYPSGSGGGSAVAGGGEEPAYEIWQYQDTGYIYLFIEENRFGAWSLIFSTDRDVATRADWYRRIGPEAYADLKESFGIVPGP
jgi:GWxTD domain-containing protein